MKVWIFNSAIFFFSCSLFHFVALSFLAGRCLHLLQNVWVPSHPAEKSVLFLKMSFSAPLNPHLLSLEKIWISSHITCGDSLPNALFENHPVQIWVHKTLISQSLALLWHLINELIHYVKQNGEPLRVFACNFFFFFLHGKSMTLNFGYALLFLKRIVAVVICQIQGTSNTDRWCFQNDDT